MTTLQKLHHNIEHMLRTHGYNVGERTVKAMAYMILQTASTASQHEVLQQLSRAWIEAKVMRQFFMLWKCHEQDAKYQQEEWTELEKLLAETFIYPEEGDV